MRAVEGYGSSLRAAHRNKSSRIYCRGGCYFSTEEDILLLQDGPPLLIDQPEDDLNMKIINEIVEALWQAKTHRQVIFASHNANLVVNGDAEFVICCDYRTTATESGGQIKFLGAIDVPEINHEIAEVMEGGVEAFKLRYPKYGF
jgi:chromosome segregation protein